MANPIIVHIESMLRTLDQNQLRAVYMMVKELYELQKTSLLLQ